MNQDKSAETLADRLHSCAIHLLRRLRRSDALSDISGPALSALSVVVHAGPIALGQLAEAEQVSAASMSRLAAKLEADGLIERRDCSKDGRSIRLRATRKGRSTLEEGRRQRVEALASVLDQLDPEQRRTLTAALPILEQVVGRGSG